MDRSRLDRVQVDVAGNVVEITWAERDWLLNKINAVSGFESIVAKFEAVGASRPVKLDFDERARLRAPLARVHVRTREVTAAELIAASVFHRLVGRRERLPSAQKVIERGLLPRPLLGDAPQLLWVGD